MSPARHKLRTLTRSQILVLTAAAAAVLFLVGSVLWAQFGQQQAVDQTGVVEQQRDAVTEERDAAEGQAQSLAEQIRAACSAGDLGGPVCEQAAAVAETPVPQVPPAAGQTGAAGADGRGVRDMTINATGHLVVTYTDGASEDVGPVVGADGADGADGAAGRGIAGVGITSGRLVITFSDGSTQDLGPVIGADGRSGVDGTNGQDGRGIASIEQRDGRLVITYTDGTTQDAGALPAGPEGPQGDQGPAWECPTGSTQRIVQFDDGVSGYGCVLDEQPPETTEPPVTSTTQVPGDNTDPDGDNPPENP